jgi:hypothetical protein
MSKAQAPIPSPLRTRHAFEPARQAQQALASAYLQLLPCPRSVPVRLNRRGAEAVQAARTGVAS